ncbi:MAG: histidine kinase N-terminal 7TM domain-containing protein, partial [Candidatus Margulisbacteria bacterium]|nr:histidine kinase N-terminal 7TM domain-containing protein [Candidatus Margulisiibacteriota bacterium]
MQTLPLNIFSFSCLFNELTSLLLIPVVIFSLQKNKSSIPFLWFLLAVVWWSFFYFLWLMTPNKMIAEFFARTCMIGVILMPPIFFHFIVVLLGKYKKNVWVIINYLIATIFIAFVYSNFYIQGMKSIIYLPFWPIPGVLFPFMILHFIIIYLIAHALMFFYIR